MLNAAQNTEYLTELSVAARARRGDFHHRSGFQLSRRWIKRRGGHERRITDFRIKIDRQISNFVNAVNFQRMPLLEIKNLKMDFVEGARQLRAVDDVSFSIDAGETRLSRRRKRLRQKRDRTFHRATRADAAGELCRRGNFAERPGRVEDVRARTAQHSRRRGQLCFSGPGRVVESRFSASATRSRNRSSCTSRKRRTTPKSSAC